LKRIPYKNPPNQIDFVRSFTSPPDINRVYYTKLILRLLLRP